VEELSNFTYNARTQR